MKDILYAPWRSDYVKREKIQGCVFCHISSHPDEDAKQHVLYRDDKCFIVMNLYPYTPGHFMIIPHQHTDALEELPEDVWLHMSALAHKCVKMLKEGFGAQGVNLGMNLGKIAGAGIAEHIHLHLVPRWLGDTNFITSIGETRVYSSDFEKIYQKMLELTQKYIKED
ncbi:MAG: HIT domain-containing protein [Epsilonproteobacteria bacterium]|nr:HIT domain-containing protein [Campylobacterota bacterium]